MKQITFRATPFSRRKPRRVGPLSDEVVDARCKHARGRRGICMRKQFCPFRLAEHDYHNQRMSNMLAASFDTFGNSRLANGQLTFGRSAARLSPDRQADIQRTQKSNPDGEEGVRKTTCKQLLGLSDDRKKSSWRDRQGMGKQRKKRDIPLWTATLWPRTARVVMVTEHLIEVRDWEYIETMSERERESESEKERDKRVLREVNEGRDGQKEKHHPLTRSPSFCLQLLSECVKWAIHPDLEIMSCVLITKRPYAAAKHHCLRCHQYLKGSPWTWRKGSPCTWAYNQMFWLSWTQRLQCLVFLSRWTQGTITPPLVHSWGSVWEHS